MSASIRGLPLPPTGALEAVAERSDTIFNWEYDLRREALVALEHMPDSTQDETVQLPPMMAEFLSGMMQANAAG